MADFKDSINLVYHLREKDEQKPERNAKEYRPQIEDSVIHVNFKNKNRGTE